MFSWPLQRIHRSADADALQEHFAELAEQLKEEVEGETEGVQEA